MYKKSAEDIIIHRKRNFNEYEDGFKEILSVEDEEEDKALDAQIDGITDMMNNPTKKYL